VPLPSKLSIKKPGQFFSYPDKKTYHRTATLTWFGKLPGDVAAIPSKRLSSGAKVVFGVLAEDSCGTDRIISLSHHSIAERAGLSHPSVGVALKRLATLGLIAKVGVPIDQVQGYRIVHPKFKAILVPDQEAAPATEKAACLKCHREVNRLTKAGYCRGCSKDLDIAVKVRRLQEKHPSAGAEELAVILKDQLELHRMTTRVRRVLNSKIAS